MASEDLQQALTALRRDPGLRGEMARALLRELAGHEALRGYIEAAVQQARTPQMAGLDPLTVFVTVVVFAAMPEIERDEQGRWHLSWNPAKNLAMLLDRGANLVDKLNTFVKSSWGGGGP
jgi:hypothetical protein